MGEQGVARNWLCSLLLAFSGKGISDQVLSLFSLPLQGWGQSCGFQTGLPRAPTGMVGAVSSCWSAQFPIPPRSLVGS